MKRPRAFRVSALVVVLWCCVPLRAAEPSAKPGGAFELRDGDRVAFIGNTFFEREQMYGYLELALTTRWPDRNVTFRNVGWSGDTVFGHARAYFEGPEQGFERLRKLVAEIKPTVLVVSYGMSESFDGPAGLPNFTQGLERMLDMLAQNAAPDARFVLMTPIRHENLGPPLPDPAEHNRNLKRYVEAMRESAKKRNAVFVDLFETLIPESEGGAPVKQPLTQNGIHLTPYGYWKAALVIEQELGLPRRGWEVELVAPATPAGADGPVEVTKIAAEGNGVTIELKPRLLPAPPAPPGGPPIALGAREVEITGLKPGNWVLKADGETIVAAPADAWSTGVAVVKDPAARRVEKLRDLIVAKNFQFFNRYRPANETYIFGFRQAEQGRNAAEIPMFDKPIAEKEQEIARLRVPEPVKYTLQPE